MLSYNENKILEKFLDQAIRPKEGWEEFAKKNGWPFYNRERFLEYLFVDEKPVPRYFAEAISNKLTEKELGHYVFLARGGEVGQLPGLPHPLSAEVLRVLQNMKPRYGLFKSAIMAEFQVMNGHEKDFESIWTECDGEPDRYPFWKKVLPYLEKHKEFPMRATMKKELFNYLNAVKFGWHYYLEPCWPWEDPWNPLAPLNPDFEIEGQNFEALYVNAFSWYKEDVEAEKELGYQWVDKIGEFNIELEGTSFEIKPILTRGELIDKAEWLFNNSDEEMRFLDFGENESFWLLRADPQDGEDLSRTLIVELHRDEEIVQALGYQDREQNDLELKVLEALAEKLRLDGGFYYD